VPSGQWGVRSPRRGEIAYAHPLPCGTPMERRSRLNGSDCHHVTRFRESDGVSVEERFAARVAPHGVRVEGDAEAGGGGDGEHPVRVELPRRSDDRIDIR